MMVNQTGVLGRHGQLVNIAGSLFKVKSRGIRIYQMAPVPTWAGTAC